MIKGNESLTGGGLTSYAIPNGRNVLIDNRIGVEPADTAALSLAHRGTEEGYTILSDRIAQDLEDPRDRVSNKLHICVLLRPGKHASHMAVLSAIGALAAVYAIKNNSDHKPMIRWIGSVCSEKKYIAEVEAMSEPLTSGYVDFIVMHVSIEVLPAHFPTRLNDLVTRIFTARQIGVADHVAQSFLHKFFEVYDKFKASPSQKAFEDVLFWKEYSSYSMVLGKKVRFRDGGKKRSGIAKRITEDGNLIVAISDDKEIELISQSQLLSPK